MAEFHNQQVRRSNSLNDKLRSAFEVQQRAGLVLPNLLSPLHAHRRSHRRRTSPLTTLVNICHAFSILIFNGICHGIYNQASTVMLSRVSLIHHAALNCARRLFAIVITSVYFGVPFTVHGVLGVALTLLGFGVYSNLKAKRKQQTYSK